MNPRLLASLNLLSSFRRWFKAMTAASLIDVLRTNQYSIRALSLSLRPVCWIATDNTDRQRLRDVLRHSQQLRHWFKWFSAIILIESCYNHSLPLICKLFADFDKVDFEELTFVDANDLCIFGKGKNV